ncbi:MAG TPA: type II toxin-antitoxin system VapC family toxin [Holophaga sp.]|nr:type II toxin-antitoxin system VapC family toxin [Holophaga sp.]
MPNYLLDSNFCIACLRRKSWALRSLARVPLPSVSISSMTFGELLLGSQLSSNPAAELAKVDAFLRPIPVIPFGKAEALRWAEVDAELRQQGNRIETEDAMIAATALAHGLTLVTGNSKPFQRVKGLTIVDWETDLPPSGRHGG